VLFRSCSELLSNAIMKQAGQSYLYAKPVKIDEAQALIAGQGP
jgi:hypothetical protein